MVTSTTTDRTEAAARLIHRELVQLLQLAALAVLAFLVTRELAMSNHQTTLRDAAEWYQRGTRLLEAGEVDDALDAFRRAAAANRHESRYALAMAGALVRQHQNEAARAVLLTLRESTPESAEVNLQLARLAAVRQDVTEAVNYYHNTLYAPGAAGDPGVRRQVRLELVDFLLASGQVNKALAELIASSTDVSDDPDVHVALANRFLQAGDSRSALTQFQVALRRRPRDATVLSGAGNAALGLGDYPLARRYYRSIPGPSPAIAANRDLVDQIVTKDPLMPRLGAVERRQRLAADLTYAADRLNDCVARVPMASGEQDPATLERQAIVLTRQLRSTPGIDMDSIEAGVALMSRLVTAASQHCPPASLLDRALLAIAQHHGADKP